MSANTGAVPGVRRTDAADTCGAGSLLVLYTDGVVERRGEDSDERQARLAALIAGLPADVDVSAACDEVLAAFAGDAREDDVALLVARLEG